MAANDFSRDRKVAPSRICGRADVGLRDLEAYDLANGNDIAGARRLGDERLERREIDMIMLRHKRIPQLGNDLYSNGLRSALSLEIAARDFVGGKTELVAPSSAPILAITCRSMAPSAPAPLRKIR